MDQLPPALLLRLEACLDLRLLLKDKRVEDCSARQLQHKPSNWVVGCSGQLQPLSPSRQVEVYLDRRQIHLKAEVSSAHPQPRLVLAVVVCLAQQISRGAVCSAANGLRNHSRQIHSSKIPRPHKPNPVNRSSAAMRRIRRIKPPSQASSVTWETRAITTNNSHHYSAVRL